MKYAWIDAHRNQFRLIEMCRALQVSVSGYHYWKQGGTPNRKGLTDAQMVLTIRAIHAELKGRYGSPRMIRELRARGCPAGKGRVERLMKENGIRGRQKGRYRHTTDSNHAKPVANNLLNRKFNPPAPNRAWASDITYLWTNEGWLYLAIVLDLFNREVVGWALKRRMTTDIVTEALTMAWFKRKPRPGLVHHSDRGSQYASNDFQRQLAAYGMTCSMSRKGNCWDNAPTESWFNSFKNECTHGQRYASRGEAAADTFDYIEGFYNRKRMHSTLGYKSPAQFLKDWHQQTKGDTLVA